jgi:thiosulfate/3-mercaptopyruvate sulfurtransferase
VSYLLPPTVSPEWVKTNIVSMNLKIVEVSMAPVGNVKSDSTNDCSESDFDLDRDFSDHGSDLPHTLPTADKFHQLVAERGLNAESKIVVYDRHGIYSSPRARLMFKHFGYHQVAVLDGGLPACDSIGFHINSHRIRSIASKDPIMNSPAPKRFCDREHVVVALKDRNCAVIDARSGRRFEGIDPEPRAGLRRGHIEGSISLPFVEVLDGGKLKSKDELKSIFLSRGVTPEKSLIFSCGSGVTACVVALAAEVAEYRHVLVYDGSWAEWGKITG